MKLQILTCLALSAFTKQVSALPSNVDSSHAGAKRKGPAFKPSEQFISTSGIHRWQAPTKNDTRGLCPGLNALANHGYLPHEGVASITQFYKAMAAVPRIGATLSSVLIFYGLQTAGSIIDEKFSIGGPAKSTTLGGIIGQALGLDNTHNKFESDASATRGDLDISKNDYDLQLPLFKQLYFDQDGKVRPYIDLDVLSDHRYSRFQQSIKENPYFFAGPISSELFAAAGHHFIFRLMGNKSAEYPEGIVTPDILKSWFAVSGPDDKLKYTPGYERIPDNFYTRPKDDPYEVDLFAEDLASFIKDHPITGSVGGNLGKPNSFSVIDILEATAGVFNEATFGKGYNAACFGFSVMNYGVPSSPIQPPPSFPPGSGKPPNPFSQVYETALIRLDCPRLQSFQPNFNKYPGYGMPQEQGPY